MVEKSRARTLSQKNRVRRPRAAAAESGTRHAKPLTQPSLRKKAGVLRATQASPELRWTMIAQASHARAAKRGFDTSDPVIVHREWLDAMAEVDAHLKRRARSPLSPGQGRPAPGMTPRGLETGREVEDWLVSGAEIRHRAAGML